MDFDEWQVHPYTKVLEESIAKDYVPRTDLAAAVAAERGACAAECERMMMYRGGKQEAPAHNDVWEAAKAIRLRSNVEVTGAASPRPVDCRVGGDGS